MGELLQSINGPADLKEMTIKQLEALAAEIRQILLEVVARTGGHLAPNLGVVELSLALHSVFDSPHDQISGMLGISRIFIRFSPAGLTTLELLRQYNGLSGFPRPEESEHDAFADWP